jgi:hypothetical protein
MNSTDITVRDKGSLSDMKKVSAIVVADHQNHGILGRTITEQPQNENQLRGKYPSLCCKCSGRTTLNEQGEEFYCGVMVEAIHSGTPVMNCAYYQGMPL